MNTRETLSPGKPGELAPDAAASAASPAARTRRAWYQSISGKLLIAFGLIVALTVGATFLALIQLKQIDGILHGLLDVSMPALKLSQDVQNRAADVIDASSQVSHVQEEVERFNRMSTATESIGSLWQAVQKLDAVIADDAKMAPLRQLIARIDAQVGDLNRTVGEVLAALPSFRSMFEKVREATTGADRAIASILDQGNSAPPSQGAQVDAAADTRRMRSLLGQLYELRSDFRDAARVLNGAIAAGKQETLTSQRAEFDAVFDLIRANVRKLEATPDLPADRMKEIALAAQQLQTLSVGGAGIFALQERVLRLNAAADSVTKALQADGAQLSERIAAVVAEAERQASEAERLSGDAIATSVGWLLLIALSSLVIAGLIVWLFVQRYVGARLSELHDSMLAIARGDFSLPIPAAGPDELGDMSRALAVFRDNARDIRIAREQADQARAEAEAASRTKSTFLANMSHELRTPLNAIIGYSEILAEDASDRNDVAAVQDLTKIQAAGKHLLGLINSILDLSKIEAGKMDIYLEQVDLPALVEEVRVIIQPLVEKNFNRLDVDCAPDIGAMRTDLTKLKQSLINLLSNAAKFTKEGDVRLSVARKPSSSGETRVVFKVTDSGIGMTDAQMNRLFEAFSQTDASTTRNFGGTGLGLAITKHFATMLGGAINVTSEPGMGSTFTVELPDQPVPTPLVAAKTSEEDSEADASALTVLVVDDDPTVHAVLSATLVKRGYRVLHANDGAEALALMRKSPPDIVTLDVMMPNVDGWSVLGSMKSDAALAHIPVIMLTIVDDRNLGYSLGAAEYMTKPIDRERLLALVRRFTNRNEGAVVLVVDDDPELRNLVSATLRKEGLSTAEAVNGRAALDWMNGNPSPNLVLLDLMMPEMDGFQFLECLRDHPEWAKVPVVVLSAKDLTAEEKAFLAERTILVLGKSAQPINSLGTALAAIAGQRKDAKPRASVAPAPA